MMMPDSKIFEEARILETARRLDERDPDRIARRMQDKFLAIAAGTDKTIKRWVVLRVSSRNEIAVHDHLQKTGIETWMPLKKALQPRRNSRPRKEIEMPVFNGYLFVKVFPCAESWVGLSRISGVISLICGQQGALMVGDNYINDLKRLVGDGVFNEAKALPRYKAGERVSFPVGHAGVFEGVIEGYVGSRAVRVLSHIFGQERVIEVPLANLNKPD